MTYICDRQAPGCPEKHDGLPGGEIPLAERHCWHESTRRRLAFQYGEARANRIALGIDAQTNTDLAAWNALGRRREAVA